MVRWPACEPREFSGRDAGRPDDLDPILRRGGRRCAGSGGSLGGGGRVSSFAGSATCRMKPSKPAGSATSRNRASSEATPNVCGMPGGRRRKISPGPRSPHRRPRRSARPVSRRTIRPRGCEREAATPAQRADARARQRGRLSSIVRGLDVDKEANQSASPCSAQQGDRRHGRAGVGAHELSFFAVSRRTSKIAGPRALGPARLPVAGGRRAFPAERLGPRTDLRKSSWRSDAPRRFGLLLLPSLDRRVQAGNCQGKVTRG